MSAARSATPQRKTWLGLRLGLGLGLGLGLELGLAAEDHARDLATKGRLDHLG